MRNLRVSPAKCKQYHIMMYVCVCFHCNLHETDIHKEDHQLEPVYRSETFLDRDYCVSQGTSYNYLDPNYFPANRWHGREHHTLVLFNTYLMVSLWIMCTVWKDSLLSWNDTHSMTASWVFSSSPALHRCGSRSLFSSWTYLVSEGLPGEILTTTLKPLGGDLKWGEMETRAHIKRE